MAPPSEQDASHESLCVVDDDFLWKLRNELRNVVDTSGQRSQVPTKPLCGQRCQPLLMTTQTSEVIRQKEGAIPRLHLVTDVVGAWWRHLRGTSTSSHTPSDDNCCAGIRAGALIHLKPSTLANVQSAMPNRFPITLLHPRPHVADAIRPEFDKLGVSVEVGRVEQLHRRVDVIVTAGNSYGIMTAGFDAAVVELAGEQLMRRTQDHIVDHHLGEQPVGSAFALPSGCTAFDHLVHAPTMRTPGAIKGNDVVYTSTWAALQCCFQLSRSSTSSHVRFAHFGMRRIPWILRRARPSKFGMRSGLAEVVLPLMGTGFGAVDVEEAARQMAVAIRHLRHPQRVRDWDVVTRRERRILGDRT